MLPGKPRADRFEVLVFRVYSLRKLRFSCVPFFGCPLKRSKHTPICPPLPPLPPWLRRNMLATIQEIAKDDPVVITGDFNAERNEKGPNHFLDNGFKLAVPLGKKNRVVFRVLVFAGKGAQCAAFVSAEWMGANKIVGLSLMQRAHTHTHEQCKQSFCNSDPCLTTLGRLGGA